MVGIVSLLASIWWGLPRAAERGFGPAFFISAGIFLLVFVAIIFRRMQEAAGAVRTGEGVYEFPESMPALTVPVHHTIYRVYREDWQQEESTSSAGDLLRRDSAG